MTTSRASIRQHIARSLPNTLVGTVSAGSSTTTLKDTDEEFVIFAGEGGQDLSGYWLILPEAISDDDRVRRVAHHNRGTGELTPSRPWSAVPQSGETYELYPPDMRPSLLNNAINRGLKRLTYTPEETITPVNNQNTYVLNYSWLDSRKRVIEVYQKHTNNGRVRRAPWPWWDVTEDSGVFTLHLDPTPFAATGYEIIVEGRANYTGLTSDDDTTDCPEDWAAAIGLVETFKALRRNSPGQDTSRWSAELAEARRELVRLSRIHAPSRGKRVMMRTPYRIDPYVRPKRGEYYY